eukprot:2526552-Prymnesium_polylepis.2
MSCLRGPRKLACDVRRTGLGSSDDLHGLMLRRQQLLEALVRLRLGGRGGNQIASVIVRPGEGHRARAESRARKRMHGALQETTQRAECTTSPGRTHTTPAVCAFRHP